MGRSEGVCQKGGGEGLLGGGKLRGFVRVHAAGLGGTGVVQGGHLEGTGHILFLDRSLVGWDFLEEEVHALI
jgi:hypothetical protein